MTTTNQQLFFSHRERVITERYAALDPRQTGATNIVTEWIKVCELCDVLVIWHGYEVLNSGLNSLSTGTKLALWMQYQFIY
jgi:hypothetical protein